jgi:hypothetical protein
LDNTILKKKYKSILLESGIERACLKLDIDFSNIFLPDIGDRDIVRYGGYLWEAKSNSLEGLRAGLVIHAVPPLLKIEILPWEEWYIYNNKACHAILFTQKKDNSEGEVTIKVGDKEHPETVQGKIWYFSFDECLSPFLFNKISK